MRIKKYTKDQRLRMVCGVIDTDFSGQKGVFQRSGWMDDEYINKIFSEEDLSKLSEDERTQIRLEGMQLAYGRLYLVIVPEEETKVSVRCYDTTGDNLGSAGHILLRGLLTVMESSFEDIMRLGHESIVYNLLDGLGEKKENDPVYEISDSNIIKVNFPKPDKPQ